MQITYPAQSVISIWIGSFAIESEFDRSVDCDVAKHLNLSTPLESICEISFNENRIGLRALLEGCSGWESFVEDAIEAGKKLGLQDANAALVCYYLKCENAPDRWGQMRFLGSFVGRDVK